MRKFHPLFFMLLLSCLIVLHNCRDKEQATKELVDKYCGNCHLSPDPSNLPKSLWQEKVLPEMGARLGVYIDNYDPMQGLSWSEKAIIAQRNYYPSEPLITKSEWTAIYNYIVEEAPEKLEAAPSVAIQDSLDFFDPQLYPADYRAGAVNTYVGSSKNKDRFIVGNGYGEVVEVDPGTGFEVIQQANSPIIYYSDTRDNQYLIEIGQTTPTELSSGALYEVSTDKKRLIQSRLHRPVYLEAVDLNSDGEEELICSEFGHYSGQLSLITKAGSTAPAKSALSNLPGIMKTHSEDMNGDGLLDIVYLASQGDESLRVLYQEDNLNFREDIILRFPSVWGSSWFDYKDINQDAIKDFLIVFGDNADYSHTEKPYHGLRIYLGNKTGTFDEAYFFPLNGASKVVCEDFDLDGDHDIMISSFFPNFNLAGPISIVYLENLTEERLSFKASTTSASQGGKWLVMDAMDYDKDGDQDVVLGSLSFALTPVPKAIEEDWKETFNDVLLLENKTIDKQ